MDAVFVVIVIVLFLVAVRRLRWLTFLFRTRPRRSKQYPPKPKTSHYDKERYCDTWGVADHEVVDDDFIEEPKVTHMEVVSRSSYEAKSVMSPEEAHVLYKLENWVKKRRKQERVFAQVAMGAYIGAEDEAHSAIRCKRPDYVIINHVGMPVCVVEYQGYGHHQGNSEERDLIKKIALEKAGIPLVEVFPTERNDANAIYAKLNKAVGEDEATPSQLV